MAATRGNFAQLLAPGISSVILDDLESLPEEYSQIFNIYPSSRAYEEDLLVAGLGAIPTKPEGEPIQYDDAIQGGSIRYVHQSYGLGFQVTREMWDDDQYNVMTDVSKDFAGGIRQTVEGRFANVFNASFSTQNTIDGVTMCNTAHPLLGGGTYSNRAATDVALSVSGVQELLILFEKAVNERGLLRRSVPTKLLIPVELQFRAQELMSSAYAPYTGNNEINSIQGRLEPIVNHYLTSPSAWWMLSERSRTSLKGYWRTKPQFESQDDFNTKGANFSTFFRFSVGCTYWHGIAGSAGA